MKYVFVSGIPALGKSHLAEKVAKFAGVLHLKVDDWREEFRTTKCGDWVDFFRNKNEAEYWETTDCEKHWENMIKQSEALWPEIVGKIGQVIKSGKPAIFEGVNILPHLARRDLNFKGVVLLGESFETILKRNRQDSRWGQTEELQKKEAEIFFYCEGLKYEQEAKKYGFKTFTDSRLAEKELLEILQPRK
ncbi:MAG: hypothetical protein HY978_02630 [Candidatus Liptonbacteria bacterium]|nr:hypothetical protein [Candidatus Liptonbacteria bacterium]